MVLSDFAKKLILVGIVVGVITVIAIALHNDQHLTAAQCSKESKQCVDACFDDDLLMGWNDTVDPISTNSSLLDCLEKCPHSDVCMNDDQIKEVEELRKLEEDLKAIEKYLIRNPQNPRLVKFDEQKAKADNMSQYLINLGKEVQDVSIAYGETIGINKFGPTYGRWCGLKHGSGEPTDTLDSLCRAHDKCYDKRGYFACSCDRALIRGIIANATKFKKVKEYSVACAILLYFKNTLCNPFA
jgi:hypothetical protein